MNFLDDLNKQYSLGGVPEKLIFWNIGLFAIPYIFFGLLSLFSINIDFIDYVSLSSNPNNLLWKPWSIISYAFFHAGFFHILFNLIMLHFISRLFLTFLTQKQFLSLYLMGAIFAGLIYIISYLIFPALSNQEVSLIGASGAVMAVLVATSTFSPTMEIRLLLIGNVKLWHITLVFIILDLIQLPMNNTGGHLAHLGGALFGYLYTKQLQKGTDITKGFSNFLDYLTNLFSSRKSVPFKKVHKNEFLNKKKPVEKDNEQRQIDDILDKISTSGYESLTKEEKEFLFKAGK